MFCSKCGATVQDDAAFCANCGAKVTAGNSHASVIKKNPQPEPSQPTVSSSSVVEDRPPLPTMYNTSPEIKTNVKQGAIIGGWLCFGLGLLVMYGSVWAFFLYAPLFLVALILSIVAMAQRRILTGIVLLLCTLIVPPIFGLLLSSHRLNKIKENAEQSMRQSAPSPLQQPIKQGQTSKKQPAVVPPPLKVETVAVVPTPSHEVAHATERSRFSNTTALYRTKFIQMAAWLATQQVDSGGIQEAEGISSTVETDNTQEAIWIWSRYAELTRDYTTYQKRIDSAWTYCINNPAWLEGSTPTNFYTTYNVGWGLKAEMEYRHAYQGYAGYIDHSSYAIQCANTEVSNTPGTSTTTDALVIGLAAGSLYQYGVDVDNATYKNRAVVLGDNVRIWLNSNSANFASNSWAVSAGVAVWGVLNSYYKDPTNAYGATTWSETANTYMPASDPSTGGGYQNGYNAWYAWGHYAVSELRGGDSFTKYQALCDTLLANDGDIDGGIPQQGSTSADYAWTTNTSQAAISMGLLAPN